MKIAITGHTKGLGKALFDYFSSEGNEVLGFSRSNGFVLPQNIDSTIESLDGCDLFFNNAHVRQVQSEFISRLYKKIPIITSGSMAADHLAVMGEYAFDKRYIEETHKKFRKISPYPMLYLKMGYLENYKDRNHITYKQIIETIELWLNNPKISLIEFDNVRYDNNFR